MIFIVLKIYFKEVAVHINDMGYVGHILRF
jgi:hypothetical protein